MHADNLVVLYICVYMRHIFVDFRQGGKPEYPDPLLPPPNHGRDQLRELVLPKGFYLTAMF